MILDRWNMLLTDTTRVNEENNLIQRIPWKMAASSFEIIIVTEPG